MAAATAKLPGTKARLKALAEVGRVASVMLDGDVARRIIAERSFKYIADPVPGHPFMTGDYFDVDHAAFLQTKKTLTRLERLVDFPVSTALWVRIPGRPDHAALAVQNGAVHRFWLWGVFMQKLEHQMAECADGGRVVVLPEHGGDRPRQVQREGGGGAVEVVKDNPEGPPKPLCVLAPVRDSLDDVIAVAEICAPHPDGRKFDPIWG